MTLNIQWEIILFYVLGLVILYLLGWLLLVPGKTVLRFLFNSLLGGLALWVLSLLTPITGLSVAVNPVTAVTVGVLGIPGVILVVVLGLLLG